MDGEIEEKNESIKKQKMEFIIDLTTLGGESEKIPNRINDCYHNRIEFITNKQWHSM
jgi:hypothetical protein